MSLKNHWYIAATEAAVRKKPQAVQIFGQHYVVFHTQNNQYAALLPAPQRSAIGRQSHQRQHRMPLPRLAI